MVGITNTPILLFSMQFVLCLMLYDFPNFNQFVRNSENKQFVKI